MNEQEFIARWRVEKASYEAWGALVANEILTRVEQLYADVSVKTLIKIPVEPRVKSEDSLVYKAFYRGKNYKDPFLQIEDKIGMRFVVLLTEDIDKLCRVIETSQSWTSSLDRDFEAEREARPLEFVYQSKHYVVKAGKGLSFKGVAIAEGTPCEIQLRTLLQHAHSELTHDNIYKAEEGAEVTKKVERTVAKSMALIEAVDDYFVAALEELRNATAKVRETAQLLTRLYERHLGVKPEFDKSGVIVINAYKGLLGDDLMTRLERLISEKPFIVELIHKRMAEQSIYRQPWILLAYLVVSENVRSAEDNWPFPIDDLRPIFVDLGKTPRGR